MIKSFRNKELSNLFAGKPSKLDQKIQERLKRRLNALDVARATADVNLPGFDFHALKGFTPTRYTIHVNGPWCITFEFSEGDAYRVDFEQYH